MNYEGLTLVSLNDSLLQKLQWFNQSQDDIVIYHVKRLLEEKGHEVDRVIDSGNLFFNKQHNITEYLRNNLSVAEIKALQIVGNEAARRNILTKPFLPYNINKYYGLKDEDYIIHISDAIKYSESVAVALSCVSNDLMNSVYVDPVSFELAKFFLVSRNKIKRTKILREYKELRQVVTEGLKTNIEQILSLNDDAKIAVYGTFQPRHIPQSFREIFTDINEEVQKLAKEYHQSYIKIDGLKSGHFDFHPPKNQYGVIAERVYDAIEPRLGDGKPVELDIPEFTYETRGLDGATKDVITSSIYEKEYYKNLKSFLISKGYSEKRIARMFKEVRENRPLEIADMEEYYQKAKTLDLPRAL